MTDEESDEPRTRAGQRLKAWWNEEIEGVTLRIEKQNEPVRITKARWANHDKEHLPFDDIVRVAFDRAPRDPSDSRVRVFEKALSEAIFNEMSSFLRMTDAEWLALTRAVIARMGISITYISQDGGLIGAPFGPNDVDGVFIAASLSDYEEHMPRSVFYMARAENWDEGFHTSQEHTFPLPKQKEEKPDGTGTDPGQ